MACVVVAEGEWELVRRSGLDGRVAGRWSDVIRVDVDVGGSFDMLGRRMCEFMCIFFHSLDLCKNNHANAHIIYDASIV